MKPRENGGEPGAANGGGRDARAPGREAPRREGYVARDNAGAGARPGGGPKRDGGRDGGRGGDRGRDGGRDGGRESGRGDGRRREESRTPMLVHSSAPTKRNKDAALDSPFAKLMALREALEKKT